MKRKLVEDVLEVLADLIESIFHTLLLAAEGS